MEPTRAQNVDCTAAALFPSLEAENSVPATPVAEPAWVLLAKDRGDGLAAQLGALLSELGTRVPDNLADGVSIDDTNGIVHISEGATISACVRIEGPCFVGAGAELRHAAYLRGDSWICSEAVVGHATEVKHSVLLPGAKAPHFNYVGDSLLGGDVNLGAGVKLSNLRNDGRNVLVRGLGDPVDSRLRKFGAILGEGTGLGCNAVTNPGVVLGMRCNVWPNVTVSGAHPAGSVLRE